MAYESLNLIDGDVLSASHIKHLENGIDEIKDEINTLKGSLVNILNDKDVDSSTDDSLSDIARKFTYLRNPDIANYEYTDNIINIRSTVQSGQMQLVVIDASQVGFVIGATSGTQIMISWGDGSNNVYTLSTTKAVSHTYVRGSGTYYNGTNTQYVVTVDVIGDGELNYFSNYNLSNGGHAASNNILAIATKDVYMPAPGMFVCTNLRYFDMIGGSLGINEQNFTLYQRFYGCANLKRISANVCWSSVTSMNSAFANCTSLETLDLGNSWNTRNCTDFTSAFSNCYKLKEMPAINTSAATTVAVMFSQCRELETIHGASYDLTNCTSMYLTFSGCLALTTIPELKNTSNVTSFQGTFTNCTSLVSLPQITLDTSNATIFATMFSGSTSLEEIPEMDFSCCTNAAGMCKGCSSLYIVPEIMEFPVLVGVNDYISLSPNGGIDELFANCYALINAPMIIAPRALSIRGLFIYCTRLINVPSQMEFPEVLSAASAFAYCSSLQTAPNILNLPKCKVISNLFIGDEALRIAPASTVGQSLDFPEVTYAANVFSGCTNLQTPPYSLKMPSVTSANAFFKGCASIITATQNIEFDSATSASELFSGCTGLVNPPLRLYMPLVQNINSIFYGCISLITETEFNFPECVSADNAYEGCISLTSTIPYHFAKLKNASSFYRGCSQIQFIDEFTTDASTLTITAYAQSTAALLTAYYPECRGTNGIVTYSANSIPFTNNNYNCFQKFLNAVSLKTASGMETYVLGSSVLEGTLSLSNLSAAFTLNNKPLLTGVRLINPSTGISNIAFTNCGMDADALNQLFTDLPRVTSTRNISVRGNPGASTCNTSIATAKNWTVTII